MLPAALRSSVCVNLYFVHFFVFTLAFLVVVVEGVIPPLKLFHIACLWPPIHLSKVSNKTNGSAFEAPSEHLNSCTHVQGF